MLKPWLKKLDQLIAKDPDFKMNTERELLEKARKTIMRLKLSMVVHPDCTSGSEFDDFTNEAQEIEDEITAFLNS